MKPVYEQVGFWAIYVIKNVSICLRWMKHVHIQYSWGHTERMLSNFLYGSDTFNRRCSDWRLSCILIVTFSANDFDLYWLKYTQWQAAHWELVPFILMSNSQTFIDPLCEICGHGSWGQCVRNNQTCSFCSSLCVCVGKWARQQRSIRVCYSYCK